MRDMHRAHSFLALIFIVALTGLVAVGVVAQAQPSLLTAAATVAIAQSQPAGDQPSGSSSSSSTSSSSQTSGDKAPAAESRTTRTETKVSGSPLLWFGIGGAVLLVLIIVLVASRGKDSVTVVK